MGEGAPRRGSGGRHPRPRPGARTVRSPRWTLGTNSSSQVGGPLARQYRTAQNIWNTWLRISGTHTSQRRVFAEIELARLELIIGFSGCAEHHRHNSSLPCSALIAINLP